MRIPTVQNMVSPSSGEPVANQYIIMTDDKLVFQSYSTIIAVKNRSTNQITLDRNDWDYSRTTGKYRNMFLNENIADTRKKIKSGEYKLADLN